ncbi:25757_t:CDS:1, partial [Dentiscutata erythropus]
TQDCLLDPEIVSPDNTIQSRDLKVIHVCLTIRYVARIPRKNAKKTNNSNNSLLL